MFEAYEIVFTGSGSSRQTLRETLIDTYSSVRESIDQISSIGWEDEAHELINQMLVIRALDGNIWAAAIYIQDPESDQYPLLRWVGRSGLIETYRRVEADKAYNAVKV